MTDARMPERWLNDRRLLRLSDPAFRLFTTALIWSVSNRTDGRLYDDDLTLIPAVDTTLSTDLAKAGLWRRERDYWLIVDFGTTQTTKRDLESLDNVRRWARETKQRQRARKAAEKAHESEPVHVDSPEGRNTWTTQDRTGQDRHRQEPTTDLDDWPPLAGASPDDTADDTTADLSWAETLYDRER